MRSFGCLVTIPLIYEDFGPGQAEHEHVDPSQTAKVEVDGHWYVYRRISHAAEAEMLQVILGAPAMIGADGNHWVAVEELPDGG